MEALQLQIFKRYSQLLKQRFSDDFQEVALIWQRKQKYTNLWQIVSTDDYMPMPINTSEEYDKVVNVSWYSPEKDRRDLVYDTPHLQMISLLISTDFHVSCPSHKCIHSAVLTSEISLTKFISFPMISSDVLPSSTRHSERWANINNMRGTINTAYSHWMSCFAKKYASLSSIA